MMDISLVAAGSEWRSTLSEALKRSEVFLSIITQHSLNSQFVLAELGAARAFAQAEGETLLIPIVADNIPIPSVIADIYAIIGSDKNVAEIVEEVDRAITAFTGRRAAKEKQQEEQKEKIETNAADYIEDAILSLRRNEKRDRVFASWWYSAGFVSVLAGMIFGFMNLAAVSTAATDWLHFAFAALKTVVVIGLLIAAAKYAFLMGRSYMTEALKSADRIHAIAFGKFYLRAYGAKADWTQMKEVFQNWNITTSSTFGSASTEHFDPKYVEAIVEVAKAVAARSKA